MDGFDRIYDLHRILSGRKTAISLQDILSIMECSRATFNRVKKHMTDFLGAPIEYSRDLGGYYYAKEDEKYYELPGLWFSEAELHALLLIQALISNIGVGLLKEELYPISERINQLLGRNAESAAALKHKVKLLGVAVRHVNNNTFSKLIEATLRSMRLNIQYFSRDAGLESKREISPQRIINYRNNWYVDAWCHKRKSYRTFALENISDISRSEKDFKKIDPLELDQYFEKNYGIYAGGSVEYATIVFSRTIAYRVAAEEWHPEQKGRFLKDGSYELVLPYNQTHPEELIQDIMSLSEHAEVVKPVQLRELINSKIQKMRQIYSPA
ncbi:helix-turn-helix transcriptional regulator [Aliikangiella sp. IMCC44359]|uniref:helix-turn-helix transcriptional regulator n=1 Tax=Aliikangiella sp. IMCC44359 TaxID=3459125 RepID=UPI00403AB7A9